MGEQITLVGNVGTEPVVDKGADGRRFTHFRVGCQQRYQDPATGGWRETESNWYNVTANGMLADNIIKSVSKGTRVVVTGFLSVRRWERDERSGINVTVRAETVGVDLKWAKVSQIEKTTASRRHDGDEQAPSTAGDAWMEPPEPSDEEEGAITVDPQTGEVQEEFEAAPY